MNNIKQIPKLLVFATVGQLGSFTNAAKQLGISKSAVSQQISQLESELEVRLLNRTTREISLTPLGEKLLDRCTHLQDQVSLLFNDIESANVSPKGRFAVTFPHSLQNDVVIPAIEQVCREYPGLNPMLIADDTPLDLVQNKLDIAIHAGELPDSDYRALPAGSVTEIFCASPQYLSIEPEITDIDQLLEHRWIASSWQKTPLNIRKNGLPDCSPVNLKEFARCNSLTTAIEMALRHMGIVLIPDIVARPLLKSGKLVQVLEGYQGPVWPIYSVHAYAKDKPVHITRFHQILSRLLERH